MRIPKTVKEAFEIDKESKSTYWTDAIEQEMTNNRAAFEEFEGTPAKLKQKGYEKIIGHLIFDIKLSENFRRKARFGDLYFV